MSEISRGTERFNPESLSTIRFNSNEPLAETTSAKPIERTRKINTAMFAKIGIGLVVALVIAFLLLYFVFDDVWYNMI